ncbi:MAG TPA: methylglyoxal synthase [Stackebrandtia sp.]|jgi:methylglyoxal synthase|uniref:methylglyoxal synthase n=1 Tax=Stackebrandtia sp. TaxID=2023065 RepID=UPI002D3B59E5|nr:methylglyoxal synthase [Stackebrandtia sp.]HZE39347.1 methylglyoxal synthase [Stackebrandtia sp.]
MSTPTTAGHGIALVAHDGRKSDLRDWARTNRHSLTQHRLYATGTTGRMLNAQVGLTVHCLHSGPLGGDQQIGARIVEGDIDMLIFFWDPLTNHPHTSDVQALQRLATLRNIPTAYNARTAQYLMTSPLMKPNHDTTTTVPT